MRGRHKGLSFYKRRKKISAGTVREIFSWLCGIAISGFLACAVVYVLGMSTSMIGVSMEPVLQNGEQVLINRYAYLLAKPAKGDVISFLPNGNRNAHYYIKRVVAVPGDTVQIIDGRLHVNGVQVREEGFDKMADEGIEENPLTLGTDEYFVLGDTRNDSEDSRSANIGTVSGKNIIGKVWFKMGNETEGMGFVK